MQGRVQAARCTSSSQVRPFCEKAGSGKFFLHYFSHANKKSGVELKVTRALDGGEVCLGGPGKGEPPVVSVSVGRAASKGILVKIPMENFTKSKGGGWELKHPSASPNTHTTALGTRSDLACRACDAPCPSHWQPQARGARSPSQQNACHQTRARSGTAPEAQRDQQAPPAGWVWPETAPRAQPGSPAAWPAGQAVSGP